MRSEVNVVEGKAGQALSTSQPMPMSHACDNVTALSVLWRSKRSDRLQYFRNCLRQHSCICAYEQNGLELYSEIVKQTKVNKDGQHMRLASTTR
jgi:hypothetical protein